MFCVSALSDMVFIRIAFEQLVCVVTVLSEVWVSFFSGVGPGPTDRDAARR